MDMAVLTLPSIRGGREFTMRVKGLAESGCGRGRGLGRSGREFTVRVNGVATEGGSGAFRGGRWEGASRGCEPTASTKASMVGESECATSTPAMVTVVGVRAIVGGVPVVTKTVVTTTSSKVTATEGAMPEGLSLRIMGNRFLLGWIGYLALHEQS